MSDSASSDLVLAIDLGGTRFRIGLVDREGRLAYRASLPTRASEGPRRLIARLALAGRRALSCSPPEGRVLGVGVATPGPVDPWAGVVFTAPNLPGWQDVPLKAELEEALGLPAVVGNDANLGGLGEALFGAGRGHANLVYLTVSTGIGSGILVDGRLLVGARGLASEAGHMVVRLDGPRCGCGKRGCLEALASGTAIAARAAERLTAGESSALAARRPPLTAEHVASAALRGDRLAREVLLEAARVLGEGIANLVHLVNPSLVVLGGGVTRSGSEWWQAVTTTVDQATWPAFRRGLQVVPAALGDDQGLLGAAAAAFEARVGRVA